MDLGPGFAVKIGGENLGPAASQAIHESELHPGEGPPNRDAMP